MSEKTDNSGETRAMSLEFEQIAVGDSASMTREFTFADLKAWMSATGEEVLSGEGGLGILATIASGLASSKLPGTGSVVKSINISLSRSINAGDRVSALLTVREKRSSDHIVLMDAEYKDSDGALLARGTLEVLAPKKSMPLRKSHSLDQLFDQCRGLPELTTGVVWPMSEESLEGAIISNDIIKPVLYGPKDALKSLSNSSGLNIDGFGIVDSRDPEDAAQKAASDAGVGKLKALMKGALHSDVFLHAILTNKSRLTTGRLLSHCALISIPTFPKRIILSDVALNITPDVGEKRDICQSAIGFARACGIVEPKVAVLSAVETISTKMPSTMDAALLAKMSDRGQIRGGIVDGPLDLDAAIDREAAKVKKITSPVAGNADVLIVPNIEAGNMIYKEFVFMADAESAGLIVGARVPVILTSRADSAESRRYSAALAVIYSDALTRDPSGILMEV